MNDIIHFALITMNKTLYNSTYSGLKIWKTHMVDTLDCEQYVRRYIKRMDSRTNYLFLP